MTDQEIYAGLTDAFRTVMEDDAIALDAETTERDMPFADSVKMVQLILEVERRFGVRVRSRDIDHLRTAADWVRLIHAQKS